MNTFSSKEISPDEYKGWFEQHLAVLQGRSPFHQPAWLSAVAKGSGYRVVFIGHFDGGTLTAVTPGFLNSFGPFRLFGSPLRGAMTPNLGPIGIRLSTTNHNLSSLLEACGSFAREHWGVLYTEFTLREPSTTFGDQVSATIGEQLGARWEHRKLTSYYLDLTHGEQGLWARMQTRFRTSVRKSQRLGMRIVALKDWRRYYQMINETLGRRGTSSWQSAAFFKSLLELVPPELLWALAVEYEGNMIAAGLFVHDEQEAHYLSSASLSQYRSLPTSYLLNWHAIVSSVDAGLRIYDLGGRPTPNIDLFKKSFSPEVATYALLTHSSIRVRYAKNLVVASLPYLRALKRRLNRISTPFKSSEAV